MMTSPTQTIIIAEGFTLLIDEGKTGLSTISLFFSSEEFITLDFVIV